MAVSMTEAAVQRVRTLCKKRQTPDAVLRVGVRGGGCSGLSYFMDFVETPEEKDKIFEFGDPSIILAVDRKSYLFLNGTEIHFAQTMMKSGFEFNNPIAGRSCSCGESFTL
jgi:iron-sulfur cluster assembly protein